MVKPWTALKLFSQTCFHQITSPFENSIKFRCLPSCAASALKWAEYSVNVVASDRKKSNGRSLGPSGESGGFEGHGPSYCSIIVRVHTLQAGESSAALCDDTTRTFVSIIWYKHWDSSAGGARYLFVIFGLAAASKECTEKDNILSARTT